MTHLPLRKRFPLLIISLSMLGCGLLVVVWLLFGRDYASAQTVKGVNDAEVSIKATGLAPARSVPLYGFNGNNIRGPVWSTPSLMKKIKALKPQIIRYPGGSVSDWWDWKTGWFVNSTSLPKQFRNIPKIDMGLGELKKVVDATGCQIMFTLNMISASLPDQIAMLQQAQKIGIPVKWVELGNEFNLSNSDGMKKFKNANNYRTSCNSWVAEIKKYFPNAKIAVVGGNKTSIEGRSASSLYAKRSVSKDWNNELEVTSTAHNSMLSFVYHAYPSFTSSGFDYNQIYHAIQSDFKDQGFESLSKKNAEIWVTEYNLFWTNMPNPSKDKTKQYVTSWGNALGIALETSTLTNLSDKITILLNHNLTSFTRFAAIETAPKATLKYLPNGIAMLAWLKAANGMTSMAKITFANNQNKSIPDYQLFGWKFTNASTQKAILVNLTNNAMAVDLRAASLSQDMPYQILYAGKNQQISGLGSVHKQTGTAQGAITLPPFSITNLGQ